MRRITSRISIKTHVATSLQGTIPKHKYCANIEQAAEPYRSSRRVARELFLLAGGRRSVFLGLLCLEHLPKKKHIEKVSPNIPYHRHVRSRPEQVVPQDPDQRFSVV